MHYATHRGRYRRSANTCRRGAPPGDEDGGSPGPVGHEAGTRHERISVRLKWLLNASFVDHVVAQERGFFQSEHLEVRIQPGGFELDPIRLVASGEDTFGLAGADGIILARSRGVPVVAIGVVHQTTPATFIVKTSSGIVSPRDFAGHRVATKPGTDVDTFYRAMLVAAARLLKQANPALDEALQAEMIPRLREMIMSTGRIGEMNLAGWRATAEALRMAGKLTQDVDVGTCFDAELLP